MKMTTKPGNKPIAARRGARSGASCAAAIVLLFGGLSACQQGGSTGEPEAVGAPPQVRRLTESQYRATVADIFAPDISIVGRFERPLRAAGLIAVGTSESGMSAFAVEQYDASAVGVAQEVVSEARRGEFVPCEPQSETSFDEACARQFVELYGPRLFRRPMSDEQINRFVEAARTGHERLDDFYNGLGIALAGMMVSPEFLLRIERTEPDPDHPGEVRLDAYSKAERLSYFLMNSTPDEELLRAAAEGELHTEEGLTAQVERLMTSPRSESAVRSFFEDMLEFEKFNELAKDPVIYPAWNSVVMADAQEQTMRTILSVVLDEDQGDYRDIFTTRKAPLTRSLGTIYRMPVRTRNDWEMSEFPEGGNRAGIQAQIGFLALHSHPGRSSATLRGVALREVLLCQEVPEPPVNVDFSLVEETNAELPTLRDRLEVHDSVPSCAGCHAIMDPVGLTLENFDGAGGFRTEENGAAIDVSGNLDGASFDTPVGLGQALHDHPDTSRCLVDKMYHSALGRETSSEESPFRDYLNNTFEENGYRVPDLMRTIALSRSFYAVSAPEGEQDDSERAEIQTKDGEPT